MYKLPLGAFFILKKEKMKHGIEKQNRASGSEVKGVDKYKVGKTMEELTDLANKRGPEIIQFKVFVEKFFSTQELHIIADRVRERLLLRVVEFEKNPHGTDITLRRVAEKTRKRTNSVSIKTGGMGAWH